VRSIDYEAPQVISEFTVKKKYSIIISLHFLFLRGNNETVPFCSSLGNALSIHDGQRSEKWSYLTSIALTTRRTSSKLSGRLTATPTSTNSHERGGLENRMSSSVNQ
jgi:hypothetical protein